MTSLNFKNLFVVLFFPIGAWAQLPTAVTIGEPSSGGSGCPQGSVRSTLSPDQQTLSILFDEFVAEAGDQVGRSKAAADCIVKVPLRLPVGYQIRLVTMDLRGFTVVPSSGYSSISSRAAFDVDRIDSDSFFGLASLRVFRSHDPNEFALASTTVGPQWSRCGQPITVTSDTRLVAQADSAGGQTLIGIDSADTSVADLKLGLQWQPCTRFMDPAPPCKPIPGRICFGCSCF